MEGGGVVLHYNHTYGAVLEQDNCFITKIRTNYPDTIIVDDRCLCIPALEITKGDADLYLFSTGNTKVVDVGFGGFAFMQDRWQYRIMDTSYNPTCLANF